MTTSDRLHKSYNRHCRPFALNDSGIRDPLSQVPEHLALARAARKYDDPVGEFLLFDWPFPPLRPAAMPSHFAGAGVALE
jgi:hypothetical protein